MANESFITRILGIFKSNDPEAEKKRQLRAIAKELNKNKFKFFKTGPQEAQPALGKFFFEIYKTIAPAQSMFNANQNPKMLINWTLDYSFSEEQLKLLDRLDEDYIEEQSKSVPLEQLSAQVRQDLQKLQSTFDASRIAKIDELYNQLLEFKAFCCYDYYFMLKKFDNTIREGEFGSVPHLEPIRGEYIKDDLIDFLTVAWVLPLTPPEWTNVFALVKAKKGIDPIAVNQWNKVLNRLRDVRTAQTFEMILKLVSDNPDYVVSIPQKTEHIADAYFEKLRQGAEQKLRALSAAQENNKVNQLVKQIFGETDVERMKAYTESAHTSFTKHGLQGYIYQAPMNYLKTFMLDIIKADVRVFCDIVLVRGEWTTNTLAAPMSEAYNSLLETSNQIIKFDESIADGTELSNKLKNYLLRCDRDQEAKNVCTTILNDINGEAREIMVPAIQNIIIMGKNIKALVEDHEKARPELIVNWKALDHFAEIPIKTQGIDIYKKLYLFINLMQMYLKR
ncbi:MAG: DUF5312 family protein [Treponemataceae bacterium]|nr:DUF5312 family protein [Treponemataceae bacterium]